MSKNTVDKQFVSDIDLELKKFNAAQTRSPAQQAEVDKYQRVHQQRDHKVTLVTENNLWDF